MSEFKLGDEVEYIISLTIKKLDGKFAYLTDEAGITYYLPLTSLLSLEQEVPTAAPDGSC